MDSKRVIPEEPINFVNVPGLSHYESTNFKLTVDEVRWQVLAKSMNPDVIDELPSIALTYVRALPETVYRAVGFNFEWRAKGTENEDIATEVTSMLVNPKRKTVGWAVPTEKQRVDRDCVVGVAHPTTGSESDTQSELLPSILSNQLSSRRGDIAECVYEIRRRLEDISFMLDFMVASEPRVENAQDIEEQVLESFKGKLERIEGDIAYVTLVDSKGQEAFADCDVAELMSQGILEGTCFTCTVKKRNNETVVTFEPIPRRQLSDKEWHQLRQETIEKLGDYDPRDDY